MVRRRPPERPTIISRQLDVIIDLLAAIHEDIERIPEQRTEEMADAKEALDKLRAEIAENSDAISSAVTFIDGLSQQLKAAIAANDPVALRELSDQLDSQTRVLAEAVVRNTTSDPTPPPEPPVEEQPPVEEPPVEEPPVEEPDPNAPRVDNTLPGDLPPDDEPHVEHRARRR